MQINEEKTGKEKKFLDLSLNALKESGLKLYDLKYMQGQKTLRIYIINEESKTASLDECSFASSLILPLIESVEKEEDNWIPRELTIEVSSPGTERELKTKEHFAWALGQVVEINVSGQKEIGELLNLKDDGVTLENKKGEKVFFLFENIKKANLKHTVTKEALRKS